MGKEKGGFLTPKAIANRIKSKGLQRLRWYCQMCQKQCRDENGYKCHTTSEAHHRQMKLFMENGGKFISSFSSEFLKGYLDIVRRQFGGKRVHSNVVYQEYIKEKEHIHMNATRWHSLTGLCMWLGKQGICRVDETEKGWYIEYIDRDPEKEKREKGEARLEKTEDEVNRHFLEKQIECMRNKAMERFPENQPQPLIRDDDENPIRLEICLASKKPKIDKTLSSNQSKNMEAASSSSVISIDRKPNDEKPFNSKPSNPLLLAEKKAKEKVDTRPTINPILANKWSSHARRNVLEEIMEEEEQFKDQRNRKDYWMTTGIVVKLINRKLPRELLYKRALITDLENNYTAIVQVLNGTTKLKVDQEHVQTVIPPVGGYVLIVNGAYRGEVAQVKQLNNDEGLVDIVIDSGLCRGRLVREIMMEDICMLHCDET